VGAACDRSIWSCLVLVVAEVWYCFSLGVSATACSTWRTQPFCPAVAFVGKPKAVTNLLEEASFTRPSGRGHTPSWSFSQPLSNPIAECAHSVRLGLRASGQSASLAQ
jgi:hypothetical protein